MKRPFLAVLGWWAVENGCIWLPCFVAAALCPIPNPDASFFQHFWFYLSSGNIIVQILIYPHSETASLITSANPSLSLSKTKQGTITIEGGFLLSHVLVHTVFKDVPRFDTGGQVRKWS